MARQVVNLIGEKFGRLNVIGRNPNRGNKGQLKWDCICDCGKEHIVTGESLRSGKSKSCGCIIKGNGLKLKDRKEALMKNIYSHIRTRYKKRFGLEVLSYQDFSKLSLMNCHYCGEKPSHIVRDVKGKIIISDTILLYNGLDRIDSLKGYTLDNVVPCCRRCNVAKLNSTYNEFKEWVVKIFNHWV